MNDVVLKSYAKINLFLKVGKKLKKTKLHNIQSLIFLINLKDEIIIKKIYGSKDVVKFTGKFKKNIKKKNNSIKKSLLLLRRKKFIEKKTNYKIVVKKNIPVFSGLGGGSSNAASVIQYFLKGRKILKQDIDYFSKHLGSDLKLFFKSKKVFQKNLSTIVDFKKHYTFYFLLIYPFLKGSTKEIYSKLKKFELIKNEDKYKKNSRSKFINALQLSKNSLEKVVISKFPAVGKILEEMRLIKNCQLSRVTGSGSACFALFLNKKDGALALRQIKKKFPKFWCVLCKTI
mgnify:FL=1